MAAKNGIWKRLVSLTLSALLVSTNSAPAQSSAVTYSVNQKTLATFSSPATTLTSQQKAQVRAALEANPDAEKFICTGIRYVSQRMSINIMVRKRAKDACDYAKELNPNLSTWYQNKPTEAWSYAGKVLLTIKTPSVTPPPEEIPVEIPNLVWNWGVGHGFSALVALEFASFSTPPVPAGWESVETESGPAQHRSGRTHA